MTQYLIRRGLISAVTLVVISMVVYGILYLAPGDPLSGFANNPNVPPARRAEIAENMGLNEPLHVQYWKWASNYAQGDWSDSFSSRKPARDIVMGRLPVTLAIIGSSFVLSLLIAIPVGVIAALKQYSVFDQVSTSFAFLGFSLPTFFSGLLLILLFSVKLDWLPFVFDSTTAGFWPNIKQSIMPVTVLALAGSASLTRFVRASMLEIISQDYVRTARAKGMRERVVVVYHAMRNALIPVGDDHRAPDPRDLRRRDHHRADLQHPGDRLPADQLHQQRRHAGRDGDRLRDRRPGRALQRRRRRAVRDPRPADQALVVRVPSNAREARPCPKI
jgi:peptide/nickel transport system permease protein